MSWLVDFSGLYNYINLHIYIEVIQITSRGAWPLACVVLGGSSTTTMIAESTRVKDLDNGKERLCCWLYKQTFEGNYSVILSLPC